MTALAYPVYAATLLLLGAGRLRKRDRLWNLGLVMLAVAGLTALVADTLAGDWQGAGIGIASMVTGAGVLFCRLWPQP